MTPIEKASVRHYHKHRFQQANYDMAQKQGWTNEENPVLLLYYHLILITLYLDYLEMIPSKLTNKPE